MGIECGHSLWMTLDSFCDAAAVGSQFEELAIVPFPMIVI